MSDTSTPIPPAIARIAPDGKLTPRQRRRLLIDMALRRQKPGTGSSLEFLRQRTAMNPWPDLREILGDVPWVIIGGVATRAYMPERMTKDLDVLVLQAHGDEALERLKRAGYQVVSRLALPGYLLRSPGGVEIDLMLGDQPWLATALERPVRDAAGLPVLDLPYLILTKLSAARTQDWADVTRMLGLASDADLERVRAVVARYSPEDREDLESLIFLGQQELKAPPPEE